MKFVIALGANLGDCRRTLNEAVRLVSLEVGKVLKTSSFIETEALVPVEREGEVQPSYLNGVVVCDAALTPQGVLDILLDIEKRLGRVRGVTDKRWGPRTIDLDLIAADSEIIETPTLTIPHPEMHKRLFVLVPMAEVYGEWLHPKHRKTVREMLKELKSQED